jgi:hypothetical protein
MVGSEGQLRRRASLTREGRGRGEQAYGGPEKRCNSEGGTAATSFFSGLPTSVGLLAKAYLPQALLRTKGAVIYASDPGQFPLICIASISTVFFALSMSFTLMRMNSSALPLSL